METKDATHITMYTLVGVGSLKNFPLSSGNCFSVKTSDGGDYQIVNFGMENLEEVVKRGVTWPIKIGILSKHIAVIHDSRIPDDWYSGHFCETCCPDTLLPFDQRLAHERQTDRGERTVHKNSISVDLTKRPTL